MMTSLKSRLQTYKARLKDHYYRYRIHATSNPYQIVGRGDPYKVIFILGHMRSASSLLVHLLNSNPEIIGYGETHIRYGSEADIKKLLYKVYSHVGSRQMDHAYVLDKLLHNSKLLNDNILQSELVYPIFLIRNPEQTLPSILKIKPKWSQEKTVDHYRSRLATLQDYVKLIKDKERSLFITYEQLLHQTPEVFRILQEFLRTQHAFSETYQVLQTTGKRGVGDPSEKIKQGVIVRNSPPSEQEVSLDWTKSCREDYERCYAVLSEYSTGILRELKR